MTKTTSVVNEYATTGLFYVATESCRAHDAERALRDASYTARHCQMPTFRRVTALQLTKSLCAKLSSLPLPQLLAQTIAIKASTPKGGSLSFYLHIQLWEKVPGHAMGSLVVCGNAPP